MLKMSPITTFALQKDIVVNQVEHITNIPTPTAKTGIMQYNMV
jgi:hypothetical protein